MRRISLGASGRYVTSLSRVSHIGLLYAQDPIKFANNEWEIIGVNNLGILTLRLVTQFWGTGDIYYF